MAWQQGVSVIFRRRNFLFESVKYCKKLLAIYCILLDVLRAVKEFYSSYLYLYFALGVTSLTMIFTFNVLLKDNFMYTILSLLNLFYVVLHPLLYCAITRQLNKIFPVIHYYYYLKKTLKSLKIDVKKKLYMYSEEEPSLDYNIFSTVNSTNNILFVWFCYVVSISILMTLDWHINVSSNGNITQCSMLVMNF